MRLTELTDEQPPPGDDPNQHNTADAVYNTPTWATAKRANRGRDGHAVGIDITLKYPVGTRRYCISNTGRLFQHHTRTLTDLLATKNFKDLGKWLEKLTDNGAAERLA